MIRNTIVMLLALALCAPVHAATFPNGEEIQATAWASNEGIRGAGAAIAMPDVSIPFGDYVAARVGLTNFQGYTSEAGAIKLCVSVSPCALRPYGAVTRPGFYQRNIDSTKTLGNVPYNYNVFRPDSTRPTFWVMSWASADSYLSLLSSDSPLNLSGFPNVFTGAASTGPWWGVARVQGWAYTVGSTAIQSCYTGTASRNMLTGDLPRTTACASGGPGIVIWQHSFAKRVAIPIVSK